MRVSKLRNGEMKYCTGCETWKHQTEFNKRGDKVEPHQEQYRSRCKDCCSVQSRKNILANPRASKEAQWRQRGIEINFEDFNTLLELQKGLCAICGKEEVAERMIAVDHCHETGMIRGLLCVSCNTKLGWFEKYQSEIHDYLGLSVKEKCYAL